MSSKALELLARTIERPVEELDKVSEVYPFALTPFLLKRIEEGTYSPAAFRQFLPDLRELQDMDSYIIDPTDESHHQPARSTIQAYNNRLVIILSHQCLVYCRFCFRKSFVGFPQNSIPEADLEEALAYVSVHPEIEDIVLSGGDPLAVPNRKLIPFLRKLASFSHVKVIRIDSRAINTFPKRIDEELIDFLSSDDRFWYHAHMNHPDDINHPDVISAVRRLLSARVPVLNQSVLLKDVNDDVETMIKLMNLCYQNKVIPYNLYVFDHVKGAAHFDVPIERVIEVYKAISNLPGPAQPVLVYVDKDCKKHRAVYDESFDLHDFFAMREKALFGETLSMVKV